MAPDPASAFVGGPCCPTLGFVIALWIMLTFRTLLSSNFVSVVLRPKKLEIKKRNVKTVERPKNLY
jgi:hypothetical protein